MNMDNFLNELILTGLHMHRFLQLWHFLLKGTWPSVILCMFYHMRTYLERYVQTGMNFLQVDLFQQYFWT